MLQEMMVVDIITRETITRHNIRHIECEQYVDYKRFMQNIYGKKIIVS